MVRQERGAGLDREAALVKTTVDIDGLRIELDDEMLVPFEAELEELGETEPVRMAYAATHVVMEAGYAAVGHTPDRPGAPEEITRAKIDQRVRLGGVGPLVFG